MPNTSSTEEINKIGKPTSMISTLKMKMNNSNFVKEDNITTDKIKIKISMSNDTSILKNAEENYTNGSQKRIQKNIFVENSRDF